MIPRFNIVNVINLDSISRCASIVQELIGKKSFPFHLFFRCALECLQALVSVSCCAQLEEALSSQLLNPHGDTVEDFLNGLSNIAL